MKSEKLLSELNSVLQKYADGQEAGDDTPEPTEPKPSTGTPAAKGAVVNSEAVESLTDKIAEKFAAALAKNKGVNPKEQRDVADHVRTKIMTNWGGLKEIEYPSDISNLSKEEKIVTFFKALMYHRVDPQSHNVLRALVEGTTTEGGFLVPEELRAEVFRVLPDMAVMRRIARVFPMSSSTLDLNSLTARPAAYWTAEYASKSTTSAEFGQVTLTANDLVCLLPVSEQLIADANINVVQFIIELFAETIAAAEDKAFFTGSGTGQPKGINQESITSIAAGGLLTMDTIINLIHSVPQRVRTSPRAAFVGGRNAISNLRRLKDADGAYMWRDGGNSRASAGETVRLPDTLYSYPFYEQNDLAPGEIYFGDWSFYAIGDRQGLEVRTTTEGGEAWRRNAMEIKAVERVDGRAIITSPFAKITGL